jgi:adhesin HecA-like repeat protein
MKQFAFMILALAACSDGDDLDSNEEARRAYLGMDNSIEKSLQLGFAGFNAAQSANIDPQAGVGDDAGTLTITGQVDQGSSANKGMRLRVGMVDYSDGVIIIHEEGEDDIQFAITYDTSADAATQPALDLMLKGIPTGTFDGTLVGSYTMDGDIDGTIDLNLSFTGKLMPAGQGTTRVLGMTHVTGTATNGGGGTYMVDVTL